MFDYSEVVFNDILILVVLKDQEFAFNSIHDLKGKRVGVQRGSTYGDDFEEAKKIFVIHYDSGTTQRLLKLLYKRIDVALIGPGKSGFESALRQDELLLKHREKFSIVKKPFKVDPNYLGFSKNMNRKEFLLRFNEVVRQGYESGEIAKIIARHTE